MVPSASFRPPLTSTLAEPMNAQDVVTLLHESIRTSKQAGTAGVSIERLEAFAHEIEKIVNESPAQTGLSEQELEHYKAKINSWLASQQRAHEWNLEMLRSTIAIAQSALKSSLLINGAAAVALLAFIGNVWSSKEHIPTVLGVANAMGFFVSGVLTAAVAAGFAYFAQAGYGNEFGRASRFIGVCGHALTTICVISSYVLFGYASYLAYHAFICHIG